MKIFVTLVTLFFLIISNNLYAETIHFIDFKYVLNESVAGSKAQKDLKSQLEKGIESLNKNEKKIQDEEKKIKISGFKITIR